MVLPYLLVQERVKLFLHLRVDWESSLDHLRSTNVLDLGVVPSLVVLLDFALEFLVVLLQVDQENSYVVFAVPVGVAFVGNLLTYLAKRLASRPHF